MKFRSNRSLHADATQSPPRTKQPKWMERERERTKRCSRWWSRDSHVNEMITACEAGNPPFAEIHQMSDPTQVSAFFTALGERMHSKAFWKLVKQIQATWAGTPLEATLRVLKAEAEPRKAATAPVVVPMDDAAPETITKAYGD